MDIKTFLTQSEGQWFSQRTCYQATQEQPENSKANLTLELLTGELLSQDAAIAQLCQAYEIDFLTMPCFGIKTSWDTSVDFGKPKVMGSHAMAIVADAENPKTGRIFQVARDNNSLTKGVCTVIEDETLQLVMTEKNSRIEERIWFASEHLRLRMLLVGNEANIVQTCFYSEIRRGVSK